MLPVARPQVYQNPWLTFPFACSFSRLTTFLASSRSTNLWASRLRRSNTAKGPLHHSAPLGDGIIEIYPLPDDQTVDSTTRLGFAIADPDSAVGGAESLGGRVIKPGRDTPWGYMALVADPDGRTVELYRA